MLRDNSVSVFYIRIGSFVSEYPWRYQDDWFGSDKGQTGKLFWQKLTNCMWVSHSVNRDWSEYSIEMGGLFIIVDYW